LRPLRTRAPGRGWVLLALALLGCEGGEPERAPRLIGGDSLPDPAAVGLCALERESGVVRGRIVRVVRTAASDSARYLVRDLQNPAAEYVVDPATIHLVECARR
jgi:hypothetical protein